MRKLLAVGFLAALPACGGGSTAPTTSAPPPTQVPAPTPTPAPAPSPTTIVDNLTGSLSAGDAPCSSPGSIHDAKPCQRYPFTVTNNGAMQATLTWSNRDNDLDLELWRGSTRLISTLDVITTEEISSNVSPGLYEVRVVYYQGTTTQRYDLRLARPN